MKNVFVVSILIINLTCIFGCQVQTQNDPYWDFNEKEHFRPNLNKGEFFKLDGFDFGWFVLEPLSKFVSHNEFEIERGRSLSFGQKALYYWWYLDAQVMNGGFVQFYYNGYGHYVPTIIKGLEYVGDTEMANLVKKADKIYQKNKKLIDKAQESNLFGGDLYDRLDKLSLLDEKYYGMNEKTMSLIENYIRTHPNEICLDEENKEFDLTFTGMCKTYYDDKKVKEEFNLENGIINGTFTSFYKNRNPKEKINYLKGRQTGELEEYFENGKIKYSVVIDDTGEKLLHHWNYENGNPKKFESVLEEQDERFGVYKEWYDNGQLKEQSTYGERGKRVGKWLKYWKNGRPKLEAEFIENKVLFQNSWKENGEQTLINGDGLYVNEYSIFKDDVTRKEQEYQNFKRHGKQLTFDNDVLVLYQEMQNGLEHGSTKHYYKNGNLKQETIYKNGAAVSSKGFPKFKNPKVKTTIVSKLCESCYKNYDDYQLPDNEPMPTNEVELAEEFKAEISIFEPYGDDHIMSYGYFLFANEKGSVDDIKFAVADNMFLDEPVKSSMLKLKFDPAIKNGEAIKSIHYVRYKLYLVE